MAKEQLNWRTFVDQGAIAEKWKPAGTPTFYIIDPSGVIRYKWAGAPGEKAIDVFHITKAGIKLTQAEQQALTADLQRTL